MMRWWLDRGVDGFRMDVINMISKDVALPDTAPVHGRYGPGGEHYLCGPRNHEYLQEMYREVFAGRDAHVLTVGEMPGVDVAEAIRFTDPERHELDMVFQFEHVQLDGGHGGTGWHRFELPALKASLARWQQGLAMRGWNSLYFGNHDNPRAVSRYGDDSPEWRVASAKTLATVLHLHRGTPYVYQGDELGMRNAPFAAIADYRDIQALNSYAEASAVPGTDLESFLRDLARLTRDNARTPMQWDAGPGGGFTTGTPWIAINPDHESVNAAVQDDDPDSVVAHHRRLIELRHTDPVVTDGEFALLLPDDPAIWAFTRRTADAELLVAANLSRQDIDVELPLDGDWSPAETVLGNLPEPPAAGPKLSLRAWESVIWRRSRP
jgi:oligo-1,6-glucosidase